MDDRITIDLDRETFDALNCQAEMHGRSVGEEVGDIVRRSVVRKTSEGVDYVAWARRIRAMSPKGVTHTDSVQLIREDRDRGHSLIVVDASVAVRWIADEANSESALKLLDRDDLAAPDLLAIEVGSALRRKEKDGELSHDQVVGGLHLVFARVQLYAPTRELMIRAVEISAELGHPIYDCLYVVLAETLHTRFVSHDVELLKRISRGGYKSLVGELPTE